MIVDNIPIISHLTDFRSLLLYIDPGTGSMLFAILLAMIGAVFYSLRLLFFKIRFRLDSGKAKKNDSAADIIIFSDDKRYWNIFKPICEELNRRGKKFTYLTASADDPALNRGYEHMEAEFTGPGNKTYAKLNMLEAKLLLATTPGLDVYQWKRSPGIKYYVHIPHAASEILLYRMFGLDYYDAVLLSGAFQREDIRALEELRNLPAKELVLTGIPYMDEMKKRLQQADPLEDQTRTILLAPSWGKNSILNLYGGRIIESLLDTGWQIIVRPHPQSFQTEKELMSDLMIRYPDSDQLEWNRDNDNFEVLRRADLLISDFSGVIFDFALVYDKPVIYTEPDLDLAVYDAWWIDTPLWTATALPRIGKVLTESGLDHMEELIEGVLKHPRFSAGRDALREECWVHPSEGARRSVDFLLGKVREIKCSEQAEQANKRQQTGRPDTIRKKKISSTAE